jgi:hypothetical protein
VAISSSEALSAALHLSACALAFSAAFSASASASAISFNLATFLSEYPCFIISFSAITCFLNSLSFSLSAFLPRAFCPAIASIAVFFLLLASFICTLLFLALA